MSGLQLSDSQKGTNVFNKLYDSGTKKQEFLIILDEMKEKIEKKECTFVPQVNHDEYREKIKNIKTNNLTVYERLSK